MSMTINKELPNPAALKAEFPVPELSLIHI